MNGSNDNAICILDSGDLLLLVTYSNDRIVFVVSSHAMSLASPIWKKTLKPPFPKLVSRIDGDDDLQDKQVDFSEDNGEALLLLLRIAHLQFSKVPSTLTFESLLDVAILYDKYDCVGLVGPWLSLWLSNEETQSKEQGYEEWLFIAWVFGREKTFKELATKLTHEVKINAKGDCLTSTGEIFPSQMPPDIIESILDIRQATVKALLNVLYDYVDRFESNKETICRENSKECDALVYGSLLRGLQEADLWPRKSSKTVHISVQELASKLNSLNIFIYPQDRRRHSSSSHYNCNWAERKDLVANTLSSIPDPVLESHSRHMQIQSKK
ncbi:hypothetical protein MMC16_007439 [Acarospora aff. strigata]|nr:hypothetical protein [Acarospora aff. strigata]